jgi:hypothetical protein
MPPGYFWRIRYETACFSGRYNPHKYADRVLQRMSRERILSIDDVAETVKKVCLKYSSFPGRKLGAIYAREAIYFYKGQFSRPVDEAAYRSPSAGEFSPLKPCERCGKWIGESQKAGKPGKHYYYSRYREFQHHVEIFDFMCRPCATTTKTYFKAMREADETKQALNQFKKAIRDSKNSQDRQSARVPV